MEGGALSPPFCRVNGADGAAPSRRAATPFAPINVYVVLRILQPCAACTSAEATSTAPESA